jgi:D-sedoheptulose 7-phosphate isomerase
LDLGRCADVGCTINLRDQLVDPIRLHVDAHLRTIRALEPLYPLIDATAARMIGCLSRGGRILWAGNGGSAADSQHLSCELIGRFERDRAGIASVALTTDTSALTAIANDYGFEQVFARQVQALGRPGDLLVAISTSGSSPNILRAVETARSQGVTVIGLTGHDGGLLRQTADICLVVPASNTARIQEAHGLIGHILCDLVERHFIPPADATAGS